jgi:fatty-acyl-CoA synthase
MLTIPELTRLADYVFHYARQTPLKEAVLFEDQRITYEQLARTVQLWAQAMLAWGVERGDRVAFLSTTRPEHLFCFFAAAHIGAVWVGLNPRFTQAEMRRVLVDAEPVLLFSLPAFEDRDFRGDVGALATEVASIRSVVSLGSPFGCAVSLEQFLERGTQEVAVQQLAAASDAVMGRDTPLLVYTSGSSGVPKGVLLTNEALVQRSRTQNSHWPLSPPRTVNHMPINHIGSVHWISAFVLIGGGCVRLLERFRPSDMLNMIKEDRLNILMQVPTAYQLLSEQRDFGAASLATIRWVTWSGGAMATETVRKFTLPGIKLGCSYGQTETTGSVVYSDDDASLEGLTTTVGRPDPQGEVRIHDEAEQSCPPGTVGEIQVAPRFVMHSYLSKSRETAKAFTSDGWLKTGDLAAWLSDGTIRFVGRASDGFKSGGYNIYPREVELALEEHPMVQAAAVVGVPDPLYDRVGYAFIVPHARCEISTADLQAWCRERLANYKIPKRFAFRTELPVLPIGKIDKAALQQEAAQHIAGA